MPDAFFAGSNSKKRKRVYTNSASSSNKAAKRSPGGAAASSRLPKSVKSGHKNGTRNILRNRVPNKRDEDLGSDSDAGDALDFDEDLRASDIDEAEMREQAEIEDDEDESPAEKRLRLAKLYLESVKNDLGARPMLVISDVCDAYKAFSQRMENGMLLRLIRKLFSRAYRRMWSVPPAIREFAIQRLNLALLSIA